MKRDMSNKTEILEKKLKFSAIGLIIGTAVGDAKGIPFETMKYEKIKKVLKECDFKKPYLIPKEVGNSSPYIPSDFGPGDFTDDTQLTVAVMKAFSKWNPQKEKIEKLMKKISDEHVIALNDSTIGWGSGTKRAVKRLKDKTHTYINSGNKTSHGCGVLMKMSPFPFFHAFVRSNGSWENEKLEILTFCKMTHDTKDCYVTSCLFGFFLKIVFLNPEYLKKSEKRKELLKKLIKKGMELEKEFNEKSKEVTKRLSLLLESFNNLSDEVLVKISNGGTCNNIDSFSMVIGILMSDEPKFSLIEKAAHIGGDTDSNAAIVGGVVGCICGIEIIPEKYRKNLKKFKELYKEGEIFAKHLAKYII